MSGASSRRLLPRGTPAATSPAVTRCGRVSSIGSVHRRVGRAVAGQSGELRVVHPAPRGDGDVLRPHCACDHDREGRPVRGIKRSAQLVSRRFWPSLGIILLASLIEMVLQFSLAAIPMIIAVFLPSPADWIVLAVGGSAAALIATTALVGVSVLLYIDLRARSEGLDLELRAMDAFDRAG